MAKHDVFVVRRNPSQSDQTRKSFLLTRRMFLMTRIYTPSPVDILRGGRREGDGGGGKHKQHMYYTSVSDTPPHGPQLAQEALGRKPGAIWDESSGCHGEGEQQVRCRGPVQAIPATHLRSPGEGRRQVEEFNQRLLSLRT